MIHSGKQGERLHRSPQLQALFDWALAQGVQCPKLAYPVRFPPGYIGSQCTSPILPNEAIITVPRQLLFMANLADQSEFSPILASHPLLFDPDEHSWSDDFRLIALILFELNKGVQSVWKPFLDSLPQEVDTLGKWTDTELAMLQDDLLVQDVRERSTEAVECWHQLTEVLLQYPDLFTADMLTFQQFSWANDVVATRAFGTCIGSNTMCPVAELLNHDVVQTYYLFAEKGTVQPKTVSEDDGDVLPYDSERVWPVSYSMLANLAIYTQQLLPPAAAPLLEASVSLDNERYARLQAASWKPVEFHNTEEFVFTVVCGPGERYETGAEVCLCYGAESNRHLLLHYGFSLQKNRYNYEYVFIPINEFLNEFQMACAQANDLSDVWCFKIREREICSQLIRTLRVALWDKTVHSPEACFHAKDFPLELSVLSKACTLLEKCLDQYPTSLQEDEAFLQEVHSIREEFALQYRRQRKLAVRTQIELISIAKRLVERMQSGETLENSAEFTGKVYSPLNLPYESMLSEYLSELRS